MGGVVVGGEAAGGEGVKDTFLGGGGGGSADEAVDMADMRELEQL